MITIDLGVSESFNASTNEFTKEGGGIVRFEYSLKALYEWEGVWKKAFLSLDANLTSEEVVDLYHKMALDPLDKKFITNDVARILSLYIADNQTATRFSTPPQGGKKGSTSGKVHTAEEIYATMVTAGVPLEWENRNLNRLLVMLRIISNQSSPSKKMSKNDILRQNVNLNAKRKARLNTKG